MAPTRRALLLGAAALAACRATKDERAPVPLTASAPREPGPEAPPSAAPSVPAERASYALFDAFPELAKHVPRTELGRFPSRVEEATDLARELGVERLFIKRDDDVADLFGGGKVRKLELYFADAIAKGRTIVITSGGVGSNQAIATALFGRSLGLEVRLYLAPQPKSALVEKNLRADSVSGAKLALFPSVSEAERAAQKEVAAASGASAPYVVSPGGTTALGTLGFVSGGLELAAAVKRGQLPEPARVYVALGLGGSAAGIALGCALGGLGSEIVAVRASNPGTVSIGKLHAIAADAARAANALDPSFPAKVKIRARIDGRFVGAGYGSPTEAAREAIAKAARAGLELDPVYTGKAFAAIVADGEASGGKAGKGPSLFWNTQSSRPLAEGPIPKGFERFF
ncbi:MAG: pyridoxal-phosphate dependent enzyme [Polyangiaceae bacterium]